MKPINLPRQARDKHKARNVEAKKAISALQARKLFYWSIRFAHWDSCRYMGEWTAALQVRKTAHALF